LVMTDIEVIQWFFDLEKVSQGFNWPVNAAGLAHAKRCLDSLVAGKAHAADVLAAYKEFAGTIGPSGMNLLLQSDDAFPEVNHSGKPTPPAPGAVVLYVAPDGKCVVATPTNVWGAAPELSVR
jgi:hypothetical protein